MSPALRRGLIAGAAVVLVAAAVLLLLRTRGNRDAAGFDAATLMPASCELTVVVPDLGRLGDAVGVLQRLPLAALAVPLAGYPSPDAFALELAGGLGVDVRSRDSIRAAGIDPTRPIFGQLDAAGSTLLAVPFADADALERFVARQAANRLDARTRAEQRVGTHAVVTLAAAAGAPPPIAWTRAPGYLLIAAGEDVAARLGRALALTRDGSLGGDARFGDARARFASRTLLAHACAGSRATRGLNLPYGASAGLAVSASELGLAVDVPLSDAMATTLASLGEANGAEVAGRLDPEAFLAVRFGGDPAALKPYVSDLLPPMFRDAAAQAKLDVAGEILDNLKPGIALALSLAPSAKLDAMPSLDPRRTNPFQFVQLEALGRVTDAPRARSVLDKVATVAPKFGARMEPRKVAGHEVLTTRYGLGEGASFAVVDGFAAVSGGPDRMETLLARLGHPPAAGKADLAGFEIALDVARLTRTVRALPDAAYGVGGFAIRAALARWLDAVDSLRSVALRGRVEQKALRAELVLGLAPVAATSSPTVPGGAR